MTARQLFLYLISCIFWQISIQILPRYTIKGFLLLPTNYFAIYNRVSPLTLFRLRFFWQCQQRQQMGPQTDLEGPV